MAKVCTVTVGIPGVEIGINYNDTNKRITTVQWALPSSGMSAHVLIWNSGNLVYDRTVIGPATGTENVPGNHTMVLTDIFGASRWMPPAYLTYAIYTEMPVL